MVYVPVPSVDARITFRVIFYVLSLHLSAVGSYCNNANLKLRLLEERYVPVQEAAGWREGTAIFEPLMRARRIPNWKWWSLMAVVLALVKINDIITNTISTATVMSVCDFDSGMVLSDTGIQTFVKPAWYGQPLFVAGDAQHTSIQNGCEQGIYKKVNRDHRFCAAKSDIIGSWNCTSGRDVTYKYGTHFHAVNEDLIQQNLLYKSYHSSFTNEDTTDWTHLAVWSTSALINQSNIVFDIKAAVDKTAYNNDQKVMHTMHCNLQGFQGSDFVDKVAKHIPSDNVLWDWEWLFQGYMYNGYGSKMIEDPESKVEWLLNSIIMVTGGGGTLITPAPENSSTQGCVVPQTWIPSYVIAFFAITLVACIGLTVTAIVLRGRLHSHHDRAEVEHAPVDLWTWMGQAATESDAAATGLIHPVKPKDLIGWNIVRDAGSAVTLAKDSSKDTLLEKTNSRTALLPG